MINLSYGSEVARWRDLVGMASDLAFETDAAGCFVVLAPDAVLGWAAAGLLGRPAEALLPEPGFNPFCADQRLRHRRFWLKHADGTLARVSISAAPLLGPDGALAGARGVAWDVTDQDRAETAAARATRQSELIGQILGHLRTEVMASRMMIRALHTLAGALGADGAMMLDGEAAALGEPGDAGGLMSHSGGDMPGLREAGAARLAAGAAGPLALQSQQGHTALLCATPSRFGGCPGVMAWRQPGRRGWDGDDVALLSAAAGAFAAVLEHGAVQREIARHVGTDALTGLPNRRAFHEELGRRLDRLERDRMAGSMMHVDLDGFARFNERMGHELGDAELRGVVAMMRGATRPGDLIARVDGDQFAVWLDGMDQLAAAERAERVCRQAPGVLRGADGHPGALSIGIAGRWPGSDLDGWELLRRAERATALVKQTGGGSWRVWHEGDGEEG